LCRRLRGEGLLFLDGGLEIELERQGYRTHSDLWTAQALIDGQRALRAAHEAFAEAGAEIITSASYQLDDEQLGRLGFDAELSRELWAGAWRAARATKAPWAALSLGPRGAGLGSGAEYHGDYGGIGRASLQAFQARRLDRALEVGADLIALETIPRRDEVEVLLAELARRPSLRAWLSLQTPDGKRLPDGSDLAEIGSLADDCPQLLALGVNCCPWEIVGGALDRLAAKTQLPLLAYPNSSQIWRAGSWRGRPSLPGRADLEGWRDRGLRLLGGCCRVGAQELRTLRQLIE
jgi:homocysteine S-methyltransferase